jgi:peptide/nickel transport system permease protein
MAAPGAATAARAGHRPGALGNFVRTPSAWIGAVILGSFAAMAALAGIVYPEDPLSMVSQPFVWPGEDPSYPLGTDMLGRDIAAGIFHGSRVSLLVGGVATAVALGIGTAVGGLAGFYSGRTDRLLMRATELFQTIPTFLLALTILAILQPSVPSIVIAIGVTAWPPLARLVRAEVLRIRGGDMVQAGISLGASDLRIMVREILPNVLAPIIVSASITAASAILTESSLAFLGLGDANLVSWGGMVGAGREVLRTDWFISAIPGLAIMLAVLGLNLLGDGLNDMLDPRSER